MTTRKTNRPIGPQRKCVTVDKTPRYTAEKMR